MHYIILRQTQNRVPKTETTDPLTKQILRHVTVLLTKEKLEQMTYTDRKRPTNNVRGMDIVDDTEIANKVIYKSVRNITFRSRSRIISTQNDSN